MLAEIYVELDDFCKSNTDRIRQKVEAIPYLNKLFTVRKLSPKVTLSEVMTILVYYHYSQYKHFKAYYEQVVLQDLKHDFPDLPSYARFVWWIPLAAFPLLLFVYWRNGQSRRTGIYYIDSTKIQVCHNRRIHQNRVFKYFAGRGKSSMGWFWGFKLHLLINQYGELIGTRFTAGNVPDNDMRILYGMSEQVAHTGEAAFIFGDKGYWSNEQKKAAVELDRDVILFAKPRNNQKKAKADYKQSPLMARMWHRCRGVVESVINIQKECFDLEHSRHRSVDNAFTHMYAALAAYHFRPKKPQTTIKIQTRSLEQAKLKALPMVA